MFSAASAGAYYYLIQPKGRIYLPPSDAQIQLNASAAAAKFKTRVKVSSVENYTYVGPNDPIGKIFYSKFNQYLDTPDNTQAPVYSVYQASPDGSGKKLLLTWGSTREWVSYFQLLKEQKLLAANYRQKLVTYNLTTGEKKVIYEVPTGARQEIIGFRTSPDQKQMAISLRVTDGTPHLIVLVSLADYSITQTIKVDPKIINSRLYSEPAAWSKDKSALYLLSGYEGTNDIYRLNLNAKTFTKLSTRTGEVEVNSDDSLMGYSNNDAGDGKWLECPNYGSYTTSLQTLDTGKDETTIFEADTGLDLNPIRWSPDGKSLLFTSRRFVSLDMSKPGDCKINWEPEEVKIYNTVAKSEQKVASKDAQLKAWYPNEPIITRSVLPLKDALDGLIADGVTVENKDQKVYYLGFLAK